MTIKPTKSTTKPAIFVLWVVDCDDNFAYILLFLNGNGRFLELYFCSPGYGTLHSRRRYDPAAW